MSLVRYCCHVVILIFIYRDDTKASSRGSHFFSFIFMITYTVCYRFLPHIHLGYPLSCYEEGILGPLLHLLKFRALMIFFIQQRLRGRRQSQHNFLLSFLTWLTTINIVCVSFPNEAMIRNESRQGCTPSS